MQRALWEQVTPNLRGVAVAFRSEETRRWVEARFLYEGLVGETECRCTSLAEASLIADMTHDVAVAFSVIEHAPRDLLPEEEWVYLRYEPEAP